MADQHVTIDAAFEIGNVALRVVGAELRESLFEVPTLRVEAIQFTMDDTLPQAEEVIGEEAKLDLKRTDDSQSRSFRGIIVEANRAIDVNGKPTLQLLVAPKLWKLSRRTDCQMFQELSVPDIVKQVLADAGVEATWMLSGTHPPRKYTVQYRETDLDFIVRLLAEEGIWFAFDFTEADKVVFCDDPTGRGEIEGTTSLKFLETFGLADSADHVRKVRRTLRVRGVARRPHVWFDGRGERRGRRQARRIDRLELHAVDADDRDERAVVGVIARPVVRELVERRLGLHRAPRSALRPA